MKLALPVAGKVAGSYGLRSSLGERRREPRTPFRGKATIIRCTEGTDRRPAEVSIRDLSSGGIGLRHTVPFNIGERFILVLPPDMAPSARGVVCTVMNARATEDGGYDMGAVFTALIPSDTGRKAQSPVMPSLPVGRVIQSFRDDSPGTMSNRELAGIKATGLEISAAVTGSNGESRSNPPAPAPLPSPCGSQKEVRRLLTRDECIARAEKAMQARTLSGVVAQVIKLAASPRSDLSELASLAARDPMLSARILQAANSASYASSRGVVSTIPEAVRNIGCATVRDIAATFGVFEAMPATAADGFNPIRCWQHSFAVATLCQRLASETDSGLAYLVGLCHDLGEILFHSHFGMEYQQVIEAQQATGKRRDELERQMLGVSHGELVMTILRCMALPDAIRTPIEQFHAGGMSGRGLNTALARVLRMAEFYANGALLASSGDSPLCPLSRPECRTATGKEEPERPDAELLRGEILGLTAMLARLSASEEAALMAPLFRRSTTKILLVRDPSLSPFDPLHTALEGLAEVTVQGQLPANPSGAAGIVIAARSTSAGGFMACDIAKATGNSLPVLWLTGRIDDGMNISQSIIPTAWPIPLSRLAAFVESAQPSANAKG